MLGALSKIGAFGALLALANACSSGSDDTGTKNDSQLPNGDVSCTDDERVEAYAPGLIRAGERGVLSFELSESDPAPPAKGMNTFTLRLIDADGNPPSSDLELGVELVMPDHGHDSPTLPEIGFDAESGSFTVSSVYLFMAGVWRVDVTAYDGGSDRRAIVDAASFFFCVEG